MNELLLSTVTNNAQTSVTRHL